VYTGQSGAPRPEGLRFPLCSSVESKTWSFYWLSVNLLYLCNLYTWANLVSPNVCVGQFNHQNKLGTRCKPNSLSATICRMCKTRLSARSFAGTGHLLRHQKVCRKKVDHAARVQSRLAFNPDGSLHNWEYDFIFARTKLCRLIARLDLPLGIGES
jgi:hypothetical protein